MTGNASIQALKLKHPWPKTRPAVPPVDWRIDAGGRHLIRQLIRQRKLSLVLEIGVFLGGSTRTWLETSSDLQVIALDPWPGSFEAEFAIEKQRPELVAQLRQPDGSYHTFLSSMWDFRDRIVPVRGWSPDALYDIHASGARPDLIYIDADKKGREIEICHQLFPDAVITGDDWWWGTEQWARPDDGYSIRKPVKEFCAQHNLYLKTHAHTWIIDSERPNLSYRMQRPLYHVKTARRQLRSLFRHMTGGRRKNAA